MGFVRAEIFGARITIVSVHNSMGDASPYLPARLPVATLAEMSVDAVRRSVDELCHAAGLPTAGAERSTPQPRVTERIAASFRSDKLYREDGQPMNAFAELSGFFKAQDGWIRTHANYEHHRVRLLRLLGLGEAADRHAFAARVAEIPAQDFEEGAEALGAIAVRVRTEHEWSSSPMGLAAVSGPLVRTDRNPALHRAELQYRAELQHRAEGSPRHWFGEDPRRPLRGIRVLDFTRVIAGPVATRTLALLGADVLRVDSPRLPEISWQHRDSGQGKRSASLDLATSQGLDTAQALLDSADVFVTGYRPGSIEAFGLRVPAGVVHATIDAWGEGSPWAERRGFDSIVQAASGISLIEGSADAPGVLPAQALDHATGYLVAASIVDALTASLATPDGARVQGSLARTASWLLAAGGRVPHPPAIQDPGPDCAVTHSVPAPSASARCSAKPGSATPRSVTPRSVTMARPAFAEYDDYPWPARSLGADDPAWR